MPHGGEPVAIKASEIPEGDPPRVQYHDLPVAAIGAWSVSNIVGALSSMQMGMFSQAALLTEACLGDGRVQTALNGRIKGVTMRHVHTRRSPGDSSGEYADVAEWMWRRVFTDELLDQFMTWSTFMGFVVCEIEWTEELRNGEPLWIPYLKIWHPLYVWYDIVQRKYVAITQDESIWIDPDDPKWFVFTPWGSYRGWIRGAVRSVAPLWLARQYALRDEMRFSEVHGLPIKTIKAPAQSDARDKQRMFQQIRQLGANATVLLPQQTGPDGTGWELELMEAKDRAWEVFGDLIEHCDREIQQVIRGTNLTSEVQGGSYAAAQVHADEDSAYADSDCQKLCQAASRLVQMFLGYNFGAAEMAPEIRLEAPDKQDRLQLSQTQMNVMQTLKTARELGIELDVGMYCEQFNLPFVRVAESGEVRVAIPLAPTDIAKTVRVDEARASSGLGPIGDERGDLLISELGSPAQDASGALDELGVAMAKWEEGDHPRRDDGKFGTGGGGADGDSDDPPTRQELTNEARETADIDRSELSAELAEAQSVAADGKRILAEKNAALDAAVRSAEEAFAADGVSYDEAIEAKREAEKTQRSAEFYEENLGKRTAVYEGTGPDRELVTKVITQEMVDEKRAAAREAREHFQMMNSSVSDASWAAHERAITSEDELEAAELALKNAKISSKAIPKMLTLIDTYTEALESHDEKKASRAWDRLEQLADDIEFDLGMRPPYEFFGLLDEAKK